MAITFGKTMKAIREKNGWTLEEMADKLDTTKQALSKYERGERTPKVTVAARFADVLNIPLETLIGCDQSEAEISNEPMTMEARIIAQGIDKLTSEERIQAMNMLRVMFPKHPELFK